MNGLSFKRQEGQDVASLEEPFFQVGDAFHCGSFSEDKSPG